MTKKSIVLITLVLCVFLTLISSTLAWFIAASTIAPQLSGSAFTGYFYAGDGSKETPYQLNAPRHVYNLAWLQYMGELNEEENGKINQIYFELIDDIDMTGVILPPIGTTEYPFVGHFDGNGYCISNLTVSNYLDADDAVDGIEERPLTVTTLDADSVEIVGFFGVVGPLTSEMEAKLADDSTVTEIASKVNAVHDLFLDNLTVRTDTERSLIGLFAGYVSGSVSNVGIGVSHMVVGDDVGSLTEEDVINMSYAISAYSLIGQYDKKEVVWVDIPSGSASSPDASGGFGGSLDMMELNKRLSYIIGSTSNVTGTYPSTITTSTFGFLGSFTSKNTAYQNSGNVIYFADGTVMPIGVITTDDDDSTLDMFGTEVSGQNNSKTTEYYQTQTAERISPNNTGYLIGGGKTGSTAYIRMRAYTATSGTYNGIYKSLGTAKVTSGVFTGSNLHLLTKTPSGDTYIISDSFNENATTYLSNTDNITKKSYSELGLQRYYYTITDENGKEVADGVRTQLVKTLEGEKLFHAIHFMKNVNLENLETTSFDAVIGDKTYEGYEAIKGALNFTVSGAGYITAVAATNYNQNSDHSLFTLLHIERNADNSINSVTKIMTIHEKREKNTNKLVDFVYNLGDDYTTDDGTYTYKLVYNIETMNVLTYEGAAYYFEIPVKAGEYAICCDTGETNNGAYLMYLDVGANGNLGLDSDEGSSSGQTETISNVTFVNDTAIKNKSITGFSTVTFDVKIGASVTTHKGITIDFKRNSETSMMYQVTDQSSAFTVTPVSPEGVTVAQGEITASVTAYIRKKEYM